METVAKVALEYDLYVIYDAVYKHLIYNDTDYINIAVLDGMRERTIYVDSFSKTYAMTGWRLGYMAGPRNILSRLPKLQENMPSCLPEFVQYAGIEALKNGDEDIAMMNRQYAERRKLVLERINGIKGLSCTPPNGAFYAFVNIKETGMTSVEFCEKLLEKEGVVTAPDQHLENRAKDMCVFPMQHPWSRLTGDGPDPAVYGKYYVNIQVNA